MPQIGYSRRVVTTPNVEKILRTVGINGIKSEVRAKKVLSL